MKDELNVPFKIKSKIFHVFQTQFSTQWKTF